MQQQLQRGVVVSMNADNSQPDAPPASSDATAVKGFGKAKEPSKPAKKAKSPAKAAAAKAAAAVAPGTPLASAAAAAAEQDSADTETPEDPKARAAKEDLARMKEERERRVQAQKQRMADIKAAQAITKDNPDAGVIPDLVANRMLARMIPFFVLPVLAGVGVFVYFFVLAKRYDTSFQPGMVAFATQAPFAISLVGITYAILSASWDPEREGSALGFDEFRSNAGAILEGLRRSSERQELDEQLEEQEKRVNRAERRRQKGGGSDDGDE
ncbi:hypothetical protein JKP88DRAFT_234176 [Tribonema minus]|uniref:Uncharacterized protein n=1 Tax=Tribonema minus TaxID=303371 RepID=A0A835Z7Y5_9STRA|nr:hypothetical protein JKP88DRAFT_234176 [Tribonema minus]